MSEQYPLEALASLPSFYHPTVSPDGQRVAFYYDGSGRNELYVQDLASGERTRVSDGTVPRDARHGIAWDADGAGVLFHSNEGGDEQTDVHRMDLDGTTEALVESDGQNTLQGVTDDGRWLYFTSTDGGRYDLHRLDRASGEREQVTAYDQPVWAAEVAPDGERIAYVTNESADRENRDVYLASVESRSTDDRPLAGRDGSDARRLDIGEAGAEASVADWSADGARLLVGDNSPDTDRVGVYDLDADTVEWFGTEEYEERPVAFAGDGFLGIRFRESAVVPVVFDTDGASEGRELDAPTGVAAFPGDEPVVGDGTVLLSQSTPATRAELLRYDLSTDEYEPLVEAEYGAIDPGAFVDCEFVTYESTDGLDVEALHYDARGGPAYDSDDPPESVPAVVMVHGGPHGAALRSFDPYAQFLVSRGYTVFQPNYRGSIGRGREFKNRIHGDWGGMEQVDIREGARWLAGRDGVDADRIAVFGGSYGGYSAYCQLTMHPEPWATGVANVGITDLPLLYEESMPHFKATLEEQMGDPEENADLWRERSPVTHVGDMTAPIFVIHGVNDPRCPVSQARRFREALEDRGWVAGEDFAYEELGEQGHGSSDIDQKTRSYRLLAEYLAERLPVPTGGE
ncbi:S9 family peptidase [Halomarina litorea]|uniref:S9 family peptidase n=1 Tax=Halomarina litorea TaxID=2961595 RepID=UPI0020C3105D|nr:alpha/beta fold hydrolase [Halomarina sp. BCD28]